MPNKNQSKDRTHRVILSHESGLGKMKMSFMELFYVIKDLFSQTDWPFDPLDVSITLSKMSDEQIDGLAAMINYFLISGDDEQKEAGYILASVGHDLNGFKAQFLEVEGSEGFSPRSHGYSKRTS